SAFSLAAGSRGDRIADRAGACVSRASTAAFPARARVSLFRDRIAADGQPAFSDRNDLRGAAGLSAVRWDLRDPGPLNKSRSGVPQSGGAGSGTPSPSSFARRASEDEPGRHVLRSLGEEGGAR